MKHLDVESTGFSPKYDDILSISIVDDQGAVLYSSLVRPYRKREWPKAMEVHGITPAMVWNAPKAYQVINEIKPILEGDEDLCAYNADFDFGMLFGCFNMRIEKYRLNCCMNAFAKYMGIPSNKGYHKTGFLTHKLSYAAEVSGYLYTETDKLHDATTDAKVCAHVWNWLQDQPQPQLLTTLF